MKLHPFVYAAGHDPCNGETGYYYSIQPPGEDVPEQLRRGASTLVGPLLADGTPAELTRNIKCAGCGRTTGWEECTRDQDGHRKARRVPTSAGLRPQEDSADYARSS